MPTRKETFHFKKRMAVLKEAIGRALLARGKFSADDLGALVEAVILAGSFKHCLHLSGRRFFRLFLESKIQPILDTRDNLTQLS